MSTISYPLSDESGEVFMFVIRAANIVLLQRSPLQGSNFYTIQVQLICHQSYCCR